MSHPRDSFFSSARILRLLPGWRGNLLLFGVLIGIVLSYFFWQVRDIQATFLTYAREHARMLAGVVEQNARGALLSQQSIEEILDLFLGNTALFVDDLDAVDPFSGEELTNFAQQSGLAGIFIRREDGTAAMGPAGWVRDTDTLCREQSHTLQHLSDQHLYVTVWRRTSDGGCIGVGIEDLAIDRLQEKIGIDRLLTTLTGLAGIRYVRLIPGEEMETGGLEQIDPENVIFLEDVDGRVAEVRRILGNEVLLVGLDTGQFSFRVHQIWGEFFLFSALLALLGGFFSWLLHRLQQGYFRHIRSVERELAREREDATLGRSAAAIAHEIRNPLNAIGMGLQRLRMEAETLEEGEQELIDTMLKALKRADGIIENIRLYARPLQPKHQPILFGELVKDIWALYEGRSNDQGIRAEVDIREDHPLQGDPHLLSQAVENLIKNSIEAQPGGGFLTLKAFSRGQDYLFRIENSGFTLSSQEADQILEPYYTTKTRGTGLGLAIVRKTVLAHGGRMTVSVPEPGVLRVTLRLPLHAQPTKEAHADTHS
jgi:signal transduction histidine kinase